MARDGKPPPVIAVLSSDEEEDYHRRHVKREGERRTRREKWRMFSGVEVKTAEEKLGDDDDCCILGCNLSYALMKMNPLHEEKDDDVSIVFERGQVACKDFPHSRHLCVKYPFSKTSHESYCKQCYCYVCDATAPCKNWTGLLGHCHASDTGSRWQDLRKSRP
ncbi:uncharacterized protein LOC120279220 [Dioscorea cayenensis subsp. rotundata]|uniref:Uncharacterized protein LOC120279220 n=1 Tax=Dioscorea cayennensis subsp. rotundata TaxID=55577 RepID=A0AB40CQ06_DIOCR|nr:uncharacterized protein LOC120279220 [Dioscorea cayenensis subsp. rotundata]